MQNYEFNCLFSKVIRHSLFVIITRKECEQCKTKTFGVEEMYIITETCIIIRSYTIRKKQLCFVIDTTILGIRIFFRLVYNFHPSKSGHEFPFSFWQKKPVKTVHLQIVLQSKFLSRDNDANFLKKPRSL